MRYRSVPFTLIVFLVVGTLIACGSSGTASPKNTPTSMATATVTVVVTVSPTAATDAAAAADGGGSPFILVTSAAPPINKPAPKRSASTVPPPTPAKSSLDANGDGFYTFGELQQAVANLIPTYTWPPRYHVTAELIVAPFGKNPTLRSTAKWQVNYEYTLVGLYHLCGWERAWLDAYKDGDQQIMQAASYQIRDVAPKNIAFGGLQRLLKKIGDAAALGDPAPIQYDVDHNCKDMRFITPTPAMEPSPNTPAPVAWLRPDDQGVTA